MSTLSLPPYIPSNVVDICLDIRMNRWIMSTLDGKHIGSCVYLSYFRMMELYVLYKKLCESIYGIESFHI